MKDLIDKRNFIEKSNRSIVKGYNVHYVSEEELEEQRRIEKAKAAREEYIKLRKAEEDKIEKEKEELRRAYDRKQQAKEKQMEETPVTEEQIGRIVGEVIKEETEVLTPPEAFVSDEFLTDESEDNLTIEEI